MGNSRGSAPPRPRRLQTRGPRAPPRRTHAWRPNSSLRAAEDGREPEKRCAAPGLWVRVTGRGALVQTRDAAARATAGAWLTVLKRTRAVSACPTRRTGLARSRQRALPPPRRTAGAARCYRQRWVRSATREPVGAGRCGAAQGRTRAVSACPTRATRLALRRQRALLCAAAQGQLHLTACDGWGTQRVGRAVRGGAGRSCWAIACGGGPPPRARTSCTGCTCASSCGATHGTEARACWGRRATGATPSFRGARCSSRRGRCVAQGRSDGTPPPGAGGGRSSVELRWRPRCG